MNRAPVMREVNVDFRGMPYSASYVISADVVTVQSHYGSLCTEISESSARAIARTLFREILETARRRGSL